MAVVGQHPRVTNVIDFVMVSLIDFSAKQFHCYMSCHLEVTNERTHCWEQFPANNND